MDTNVYNDEVAHLKEKIVQLEKDIINETNKVETIEDFNVLFAIVQKIIADYNEIYHGLSNPLSKERLIDMFVNENEFLLLLLNHLEVLDRYYRGFPFIEKEEIKMNWEAIRTIVNYNHLCQEMEALHASLSNLDFREISNEDFIHCNELNKDVQALESENDKAMQHIEELGKIESYNNTRRKAEENIDITEKEALASINRLYEKYMAVEDDFVGIAEEKTELEDKIIVREEDITIDEDYLNRLPSYSEKITYLQLILANIEKLPGRKSTLKFKEEKKRIPRKYVSCWLKCQSKLSEVEHEEELQIEKEAEIYRRENIRKEAKREYATLFIQFRDIEEELFGIANKANAYLNTSKVVAAASFKGEPFYVLKTDLDAFNRTFMEYKRLQHEIQDFAKRHGFEIITDIERFESIERKTYAEMQFLKLQGQVNENLEKIEVLKNQFSMVCKSKAFATYASIQAMFHKLSIPNEKSEFLTQILENPRKFLYSKEHGLVDKKNYFESLLININDYTNRCKEKRESVIENTKLKIKRCLSLLPRKNPIKIKNIKNATNNEKVVRGVFGVAAAAAILCATVGIAEHTTIIQEKDKTIETSLPEFSNDYKGSFSSIVEETNAIESDTISKTNVESMGEATIDHVDNLFKERKENHPSKPTPITPQENVEEASDEMQEIHVEDTEVENENASWEFGGSFKVKENVGAEIYTNYIEASDEENGKSMYYEEDTLRTITGITYEYNGEKIFISNTEEDAEAKKVALENNGAHVINIRSSNELGTGSGYEGFFNVDDIYSVENGNGMSR